MSTSDSQQPSPLLGPQPKPTSGERNMKERFLHSFNTETDKCTFTPGKSQTTVTQGQQLQGGKVHIYFTHLLHRLGRHVVVGWQSAAVCRCFMRFHRRTRFLVSTAPQHAPGAALFHAHVKFLRLPCTSTTMKATTTRKQ